MEEVESCRTQFTNGNFSKDEKKIIEPKLKTLESNWKIAFKTEQISTILDDFKSKYHNQFVFPKEDKQIIIDIVEEYLTLSKNQTSKIIKDKLENYIYDDLVYLDQKIIIPELNLNYPQLFK